MNCREMSLALLSSLFLLAGNASAACPAPSVGALAEVANRIAVRIEALETYVPLAERKQRPSLILRVSNELDPTEVDSGVPPQLHSQLSERACVDKKRLARNIVSALQAHAPRLAVVSTLANQDLESLASRINGIGVGNIDADTVTRLRAFDVNYFVVVGGRPRIGASGCGFRTSFLADIDVHSIATTEVKQSSGAPSTLIAPLEDVDSAVDASIIAAKNGSQFGALRLTANQPVCLRDIDVKFSDSSHRYGATWEFNAGCILAGETREFTPQESQLTGSGWPELGKVVVEPEGSCGTLEFEDVQIRSYLAPTWRPAVVGHPPGFELRSCGCWGPALFNVPYPQAACSSGRAVDLSCQGFCPSGGFIYGTRCQ